MYTLRIKNYAPAYYVYDKKICFIMIGRFLIHFLLKTKINSGRALGTISGGESGDKGRPRASA